MSRGAVSIVAASAALWLACQSPSPTVCVPPQPASGLPARGISAHRGGTAGDCPENTRGAFCRAICAGAHQVEFDVRATADGALVVAHDDVVEDRYGNELRISDASLDDVRDLELEPCGAAPQRVLTFEEALVIMPQNIWLNVDVKSSDAPTARLVAEAVDDSNRFEQVIFGSRGTSALAVRRVAQDAGEESRIGNLNRGILRCQYVDRTIDGCDDFIQFYYLRGVPRKQTVDRLKENGIRVNYSWLEQQDDSELEERLESLFDRGVDFVLVDTVDEAMDAACRLGIAPAVPVWSGSAACQCAAPPSCPP